MCALYTDWLEVTCIPNSRRKPHPRRVDISEGYTDRRIVSSCKIDLNSLLCTQAVSIGYSCLRYVEHKYFLFTENLEYLSDIKASAIMMWFTSYQVEALFVVLIYMTRRNSDLGKSAWPRSGLDCKEETQDEERDVEYIILLRRCVDVRDIGHIYDGAHSVFLSGV
ncbi:hypothetical protein CYLTODRAFT_443495 [Cylindrobasidium torrendii FP15055 ss-10]|uniref:Uncharacterized protein n=1 Tax=Cylindrobasidium torrendii FP15055 ss-10 TaxID=1314674 RepID=A0A0D7BF59_9AGAR|nr:hypothetical protein CYLTODRAFT_443495 [Cylindrobasidium torrendii FP15055 ss-10]